MSRGRLEQPGPLLQANGSTAGDRDDPIAGTADVEVALARELEALPEPLAGPCMRIAIAGGKRLRPTLVLTTASAVVATFDATMSRRAISAGLAIELLHVATLVHDDLLDKATLRRGVATVNAAEGPAVALLAGDVIIASACRIASTLGAQFGMLIHRTLADLCVAQAMEDRSRFDGHISIEHAVRIAEGKSGTMLAAACEMGATLAPTTDPRLKDALTEFGLAFGICLQLMDDVLDLVSTEILCGKPVGADFAGGIVTMPAICALRTSSRLRDLLRPDLSEAEGQEALAILRSSGGVGATLRRAEEEADRAERILLSVDPSTGTAELGRLASMPRRYLRRQLRLVPPEYRDLLGSSPG